MTIPLTALLVLLFDLGAAFVAWLVVYGLRFNFEIPADNARAMWNALPVMLVVHALSFVGLKTYRPLWRYTSIPDVKRLAIAVFVAGMTTPVALLMVERLQEVPRSLMVFAPIFLYLMLAGARFVSRVWFDGYFAMERTLGRPVVILGAGSTAARLIADLHGSPTWQVVALLDDNEALHGSSLGGVNIHGGIDLLPEIVVRYRPLSAFIAMPAASPEQRARATQLASNLGLDVLSAAPSGNPQTPGVVRLERVDPLDLLATQPAPIDDQAVSDMISGKVVLITGVDSPLAHAFCRQVSALGPKTLLCLDRSTGVLGELQRQLGTGSVSVVLGDCRDELVLKTVFEQYRPDVIFHLSSARFPAGVALGNEWAALRESVLPVLRLVRNAIAHKPGMFVLITAEGNPLGYPLANAGLRLAESICLGAHGPTMQCACIRFAPEVILARDDLVSEMKREIDSGGPVSVPDPQSELYFLRESDAAGLALHAAASAVLPPMGTNEDSVYVIRGSTPIRVADFARKLIKLSGFSEDQIPLVFTGTQREPDAEIVSLNPSLVGHEALEEIASWLDAPTRNVEEFGRDLRAWGIVPR